MKHLQDIVKTLHAQAFRGGLPTLCRTVRKEELPYRVSIQAHIQHSQILRVVVAVNAACWMQIQLYAWRSVGELREEHVDMVGIEDIKRNIGAIIRRRISKLQFDRTFPNTTDW